MKKIQFNVHIPNREGDGIAHTVPIEVEVYIDPETGEKVLTPEAMMEIEKVQSSYMGFMSAKDIRALREWFGLSQEEMSWLFRTSLENYTRWEDGLDRPPWSVNMVLCAIRDGKLPVHYLRTLSRFK